MIQLVDDDKQKQPSIFPFLLLSQTIRIIQDTKHSHEQATSTTQTHITQAVGAAWCHEEALHTACNERHNRTFGTPDHTLRPIPEMRLSHALPDARVS